MAIIQLKNISFHYNIKKYKQEILKNLCLDIEKGTFTLLYGKSGIGKTTILNIIAGLLSPQRGTVIVNNQNLCEKSKRELDQFRSKQIGFIFQMFYLIPQFTVIDNVIIGMKHKKISYKEKKQEAQNILKQLSMDDFASVYPENLSGGQQQRVSIARALANDSQILLADEPTGNLDKETATEVLEILKRLREEGRTIVIVSHDENVKKYCDNIVYVEKIQQNQCIGDGSFETV